jgi:hypothetical protein
MFSLTGGAVVPRGMLWRLKRTAEHQVMETADAPILGSSKDLITLDDRQSTRELAVQMLRQARRSLLLLSHDLDPGLYDNNEFLDALKDLALRSPRTEVRILLRDPTRVVQYGHRLIELMRRLNSHIHIHRVGEDYLNRSDTFMIVDEVGLMRRAVAERYEGIANFNDPAEAAQLRRVFDHIWEFSRPDPELRRLHI